MQESFDIYPLSDNNSCNINSNNINNNEYSSYMNNFETIITEFCFASK